MQSWSLVLPDFEIILHNEDCLTGSRNEFLAFHLAHRNFAFVSDYFRAKVLYEIGGIYLDTDVEIKFPLDPFLNHRAFSGFEKVGLPFTAIWGSERGHSWPKLVLDYYNSVKVIDVDSQSNLYQTNTNLVSKILVDEFGIDPNVDSLQVGKDGVVIYPSTTFCLDLPMNYATHHFESSWSSYPAGKYKVDLIQDWYFKQIPELLHKVISERDKAIAERENILNSRIWKITKWYRLLKAYFFRDVR